MLPGIEKRRRAPAEVGIMRVRLPKPGDVMRVMSRNDSVV